MTFAACVQTAVEAGRVSQAKAEAGIAEYTRQVERHLSAGLKGVDAELQAAIAATEKMTNVSKTRRWQKLNEIQRAHEIYTRLRSAKDVDREATLIMEDMELTYDSVMGLAMANTDSFLVDYAPTAAGLRRPTAGLDEIPRAAFGESSDPVALRAYNAIKDTLAVLTAQANRLGASIVENPKNVLFQTHDAVRVSSVSRDEWVNDHLADGILDWETMRWQGEPILAGERKEILEKVYDNIISDGIISQKSGQRQIVNLANRLNRDRFLYYASGNAWNAMQTKYGAGNVHQQFVGMMDALAKDISILSVLGPSPDTQMRYFKNEIELLGVEKDAAKGSTQRKYLAAARRTGETVQRMYDIHARHVPSLESNLPVSLFSGLKTIAVNAVLGGLFIPSFIGDAANARTASLLTNMPATRYFREYFKNFVPSKRSKMEAMQMMVTFEHGISIATNRIRYLGLMDGPNWARNVSEFTYRATLTSHHTQVARNVNGKNFQALLANSRNIEYDDLPFASFLAEHQISKAEWDAFRQTPVYVLKGAEFLRPLDFIRAGNDAAGIKFANAMQAFMKLAVPDASLRARAAIGEANDPNQPITQGAKAMLSLTAHPITIYFNHMQRIRHSNNKLSLAMRYFLWMTAGGMAITQVKALANGEGLYDMTPFDDSGTATEESFSRWVDFMGRSVVNGGSLGILGDVLFNTIDIANSKYRPGNPTEEYFKALARLTVGNANELMQGEETNAAKEALLFADKNIPDFWQTKLIVNRYFMDELLREADPAAYERKLRYQQETTEDRGTWWGMGQEPQL